MSRTPRTALPRGTPYHLPPGGRKMKRIIQGGKREDRKNERKEMSIFN
jgi:hypothetical protein